MYHFYIDGSQLPITPGKLQIKAGNQNKTVSLIDEGEVNLIKSAGLTDIAFDALLPHTSYPFAAAGGRASTWVELFRALKENRRTFRFIVIRNDLSFDTNLRVSLEEYTIKEDASSYGLDALATLKLKQYRPYGAKTITIKETASGSTAAVTTPRESDKVIPSSHTVVEGDNLWNLCKKYLGDATRYPDIAALNGISNPNLIYPGQVIRFE